MQTRPRKRLALNPKRTPLRAPSRGDTAVCAEHPTGTTRPEGGRRERREPALFAQSWLCLRALPQAWWSGHPVVGPHCCRKPPSCVQRGCWSAGCWASAAGRRCLGRGRQQVCPVTSCDGWAEDRWAGTGRIPGKPLCGPCCITVSGSKADPMFRPLGPGKAAARQALLLVGVWSLLGSSQPRPLCFLGHSCVPRAETRACSPRTLAQERGLRTALRALPGLICAGKRRDPASETVKAPGGQVGRLGGAVRRADGPKEEGASDG